MIRDLPLTAMTLQEPAFPSQEAVAERRQRIRRGVRIPATGGRLTDREPRAAPAAESNPEGSWSEGSPREGICGRAAHSLAKDTPFSGSSLRLNLLVCLQDLADVAVAALEPHEDYIRYHDVLDEDGMSGRGGTVDVRQERQLFDLNNGVVDRRVE